MAAIGTLRLVYEKMPFTLLPSLAGLSVTGVFSIAARVVDAAKLGHQSALTAIFPDMAKNGVQARQPYEKSFLFVGALLIAVLLTLLAEPLVQFLFGSEYLSAAVPLRILAWLGPPYVLATHTALQLVSLGFERALLPANITALIALVVLLAALAASHGAVGAAYAVLAAEWIHAGLAWRIWRKHALSQ